MKLAILDDYQNCALDLADWGKVRERAEVTVFNRPLGDAALETLAPFDILCLMRDRQPLSAASLAALPNLKLITYTGVRNQTLDMAAAAERGIPVCNTGVNPHASTVEIIWALILNSVRHLGVEQRAMHEGRWQTTVGPILEGKTLGVLGLGTLGKRVAAIGQAFGMNVIAWSKNLTTEAAAAVGVKRVEFDELIATSDVITIHLVLSDRSRDLIGEREFGLMKPTAHLVNASRGPIVNEAALIRALETRRIAGAAFDTYNQEPLPADHKLRRLDNAVTFPHLGFVSQEGYSIFYRDTVEDVLAWMDGKPVRLVGPNGPVHV